MDKYLLQHFVETAAVSRPEATAVVDGTRSIGYGTLDALSNRAALLLCTLGFRQGTTVGVYLPKSIEAIIAFHAILKAGGAYIPLDTQYSPVVRILRILDISETVWLFSNKAGWSALTAAEKRASDRCRGGMNVILFDDAADFDGRDPSVVLTPPHTTDRPAVFAGCHFFTVDDTTGADADREACTTKHPHTVTENDLAYILYTSGSTGEPKGVMITHRNAMSFVNWALSEFRPSPGTVFANHAPFHFDLSVFDIYVSFAAGGSVHLVPPAVMNNPRALVEWIDDHRIAFWYSVPSVWITIVNYARIDSRKFENLRVILFAGEVFPPNFLKCLMQALPGRLYYNLYGPTETNVCTYHQVKSVGEIGGGPVPIGKACANTDVAALDDSMRETAVGETGELYVCGPGVAVGYYKNPVKTAQSFRTVPSALHGERLMYATGDIVRRLTPDTYQFIGRKDLMVKCAGFRVELQEIENVLDRHDMVREAVVVPCYREERGSVALHAYIALKPGMRAAITKLKKYCGDTLPRYMVPEAVHILEELPRNPNGKIDRQLLLDRCRAAADNKGGI